MNIEKDFKNTLEKKDYVTYLLTTNNILLISPIIIISLLIAIIYSLVTSGFKIEIIIYTLPIVLFILSYIKMYKVISNTLKSQKELYELTITLTDNEYKDVTNGEHNSFAYSKAYCYKETKNYFYLHIDKNNALIIPKRKFNEDEIAKIRTTFSSKIRKENIITITSLLTTAIFIVLVALITISLFTV
ncbi:MAG: YcxB family protein [Bacilli bacterium]|nr:YcxB family protein [Bacilli bacterium]